MENYFNILFSEVNITLTVLLIILILYWLATMISGIDFDLDIDVDVDVDIDADVDLDTGIEGGNMDFQDVANAEVDREHVVNKRTRKLKWWQVFLIYFNFVGLPFMFTFTFWIFLWWMISVLTTSITGSYDNTFGFVIVLAAFIPALILTKVITTPFKSFFKNLNKDGDKAVDFLGREALLLSSISGDKLGNAEVMADGNLMSIYVKSLDGSELRFRESVLIIKRSDDKNYFLVSKA
ncbi:OB-fold-containig protein [Nonlabens ulvanivorans]|uniref:Membrane protein n=2 Tax=Nonlabens ulvanivorans TaxID=906888 RepID=A0A084JUI2_NONUL|nr:OB-fold-containig protein [Nonlabens ulvanivorans]KEZ92616.1 membrane protein [Nonlabens ulvanivorans]GAK98408.1 hypothetical protein JCM19314_2439 [Nonlabens ulvanivorans]